MNMNQIINMILRVVMRRAINAGVNAGINAATGVSRKRKGHQPQVEGGGAAQMQDSSAQPKLTAEQRQARQAARQARRAAKAATPNSKT